jgi:hypothetical protein
VRGGLFRRDLEGLRLIIILEELLLVYKIIIEPLLPYCFIINEMAFLLIYCFNISSFQFYSIFIACLLMLECCVGCLLKKLL